MKDTGTKPDKPEKDKNGLEPAKKADEPAKKAEEPVKKADEKKPGDK
jgi:hypothetical protein